ncbi:restriction endonuclease subunit S [Calothrix membranacea FACHB-236]|nr:restriction endonuclease subunit S [Calothrix membranacea FACHB-236]
MINWELSKINEISLADSLEFVVDNRGKTVPIAETGVALIATNCISNDHLYPQKINLRYVSQQIFDNWFRSHPKSGDIILTNKGSNNGEVCLVPENVDFCIAQDMVAVRADKKKIDPLYLFAALRSKTVQRRIKYLNVDAVIPHFKKTDFNKLLIPLPERKSQEFIGELYFNFSYKIENLRRQNETLEAIAQTLFKHWFIDFEFPNADGKPYKSSGGTMIPSELGKIPEGWRVGKLEKFCTVFRGSSPRPISSPVFFENGNIPWIKIADATRSNSASDRQN